MRDLLPSREPGARLAMDYFVYRAVKEIGALAAVLGGLDGLVFTAGIGENSAEVRQHIVRIVRLAGTRAGRIMPTSGTVPASLARGAVCRRGRSRRMKNESSLAIRTRC